MKLLIELNKLELREELKARSLDQKGRKAELEKRLEQWLEDNGFDPEWYGFEDAVDKMLQDMRELTAEIAKTSADMRNCFKPDTVVESECTDVENCEDPLTRVARVLVGEWIHRLGMPSERRDDQGRNLDSGIVQKMFPATGEAKHETPGAGPAGIVSGKKARLLAGVVSGGAEKRWSALNNCLAYLRGSIASASGCERDPIKIFCISLEGSLAIPENIYRHLQSFQRSLKLC